MRTQYDTIIAVDPDVEKSGVAGLSGSNFKVMSKPFPELIQLLENQCSKTLVIVEAGYFNAPHWHLLPTDSKAVAAAKGNAVGRNHETARKIIEMARYYGRDVIGVKPLKKCWRGRDGKITHDEICRLYRSNRPDLQLPKRTNQDERDAMLLLLKAII